MAELIQMLFGLVTQVGPRNHVLDGSTNPPRGRGIFGVLGEGKWQSIVKFRDIQQ